MRAPSGVPDPLPVSIRTLLARPELGLELLLPEDELPDGALDVGFRWMHSSGLEDPSPFLVPGLVLLTTGDHLGPGTDAATRERTDLYVSRLIGAGAVGIGFGVGVVHEQVPPCLLDACRERGLPLVEVPYATPFLAVTRTVAELVAASDYAWRTWELAAHRELAAAALRPDPLGAALAELGRQLDCWVGLFDASGRATRNHPGPLPAEVAAALRGRVRQVLDRGSRAAHAVTLEGRTFLVQTLGHGGRLRGMLVLETADLGRERRGLVSSFVAMAEIAGESTESLGGARTRLRSAVLASLRSGDVALAEEVADLAWGGLPAEPVRVAVTRPGPHVQRVQSFIDLHVDPTRCLVGESDDLAAVVIRADDDRLLRELVTRFGGRYGLSRPTSYARIATAVTHASAARDRGPGPVVAVEDVGAHGVLATLGPDGVLAAELALDPLSRHDDEHGTELVRTLRVWLEHDAEHGATAAALGVHRHTVRARVRQVGTLLGRDLGVFTVRAELWAALVATDQL